MHLEGSSKHLYWKLYFPKTASGNQAFIGFYVLQCHQSSQRLLLFLSLQRDRSWGRGFPLWQAIRGCDIIESTLILLLYFEALWWIKIDEIHAMRQYNYSLIIWLCKTLASQQTIVSHTALALEASQTAVFYEMCSFSI